MKDHAASGWVQTQDVELGLPTANPDKTWDLVKMSSATRKYNTIKMRNVCFDRNVPDSPSRSVASPPGSSWGSWHELYRVEVPL